ncbi:MAG: TIM barrel protein, partial [Bacilli bacterium]
TNPKLVYLLFDSGHLAYCNQPYLDVLSKYIKRIKHVHLKDIRPAIVARVKEDDLSFLQGVKLGAFTIPGDGIVDFKAIFKILADHDYEGYLVVEAEQDPQKANPYLYALKAREYIKEISGL